MARGLSDLQKSILIQAYKKLEQIGEYEDDKITGMLQAPEVLVEYYGWEPKKGVLRLRWQNFSKEKIGSERYNSANAAVSKSFQRLEARGLASCFANSTRTGIQIQLLQMFCYQNLPVMQFPSVLKIPCKFLIWHSSEQVENLRCNKVHCLRPMLCFQ